MNKRIVISIFIGFIVFVASWVYLIRPVVQPDAVVQEEDSVENLSHSPEHVTFIEMIHKAKLDGVLESKSGPYTGPYTIFAPTDNAFQRLSAQAQDYINDPLNHEDVNFIVLYHVVRGKYLMSDLKEGLTLTTLEGSTLTFSKRDGNWFINNEVAVQPPDLITKNGVIHSVDDVLVP